MMFDSVREELQSKVTSGRLAPRPEVKQEMLVEMASPPMVARPILPPPAAPLMHSHIVSRSGAAVAVARPQTVAAVAVVPQPVRRVETADLTAPKTNPTLVGFQSKNATLPDWRIQLQNAVQQRRGGRVATPSSGHAPAIAEAATNPAPILSAQPAPRVELQTPEPKISDPRVANALRRINESRNAFFEPERKKVVPAPMSAAPKPYKFDVVPTNSAPSIPMAAKPNLAQRPRLVSTPLPLERNTNKLPPIAMRPLAREVAELPWKLGSNSRLQP